MNKIVLRGSAALTVFFGFVAIIIAAAFIRGYVIYRMWNWFIVPLGAVEIGVLHAYGLSLMVGIVFSFVQQKGANKNVLTSIAELFLNNAFVLFIGWLVHHWM